MNNWWIPVARKASHNWRKNLIQDLCSSNFHYMDCKFLSEDDVNLFISCHWFILSTLNAALGFLAIPRSCSFSSLLIWLSKLYDISSTPHRVTENWQLRVWVRHNLLPKFRCAASLEVRIRATLYNAHLLSGIDFLYGILGSLIDQICIFPLIICLTPFPLREYHGSAAKGQN